MNERPPHDLPASTYRLQISADFTLHDALRVLPYLQRLGVDWVYLSPLLEAQPGSAHGYDVIDHSRVDPARGGPEALAALADAAHALGMGILVDIVPNHMGIETPRRNAWWWDVLTHGRASGFADYFDIDWAAGGDRVRLPVLGDGADELDALRIDEGELAYYDHRFPIAEGTGDGSPREVHDRQHYELVSWRRADHELNYRRFFAVNSLSGLRVERPEVFDASHAEIGRWLADDLADGLRVDHPDGLADPGAYLRRLADLADGRPVWVEKILEGEERMPAEWPVAGTTGYEVLADIDRVFVDPRGEDPLTLLAIDLDDRFESGDWDVLVRRRKRAVADGILNSEIRRLAREVAGEAGDDAGDDTAGGAEDPDVVDALAELASALPVYRSYLPYGAEHLDHAARAAAESRPDLAETIAALAVTLADPAHPAAVRFQQTSGMIMAKGVEDNAYYRYTRLTSLTEVGADPAQFALAPSAFHARQADRMARLPHTMTTLTTHDTKRSEDTRARIAVLAEVPSSWERFIADVRGRVSVGDGSLENLVWQAVVGAWPASRERLHEYALKAAREAGASTAWTDGDEQFEAALLSLVDAAFDDPAVSAEVADFVAAVQSPGASNGLGAKLLQLLSPGVPDVYQGSERWERSLVDPDNRRPVDFEAASELLERLDTGWLPPVDESGAAKLLVTSRALRVRREHPELLTDYRPVEATGERAEHLIGFDRGGAIALATRLPVTLEVAGSWGDTAIDLGERELVDEFTGRRYSGGTAVAELFAVYPVALLVTR
ncbi:malto-oligosyltrehalose synthase [Leifsonia poae]|uniref:Malto-oligosyltrehalose synthase n=1 Tax=Leifsonia poae TaxID=110933 RepID=A0A9W6H8M9_9MICO|nr:malto-oligosyltrehalose synthase [Leifsonia poae]GLJ75474.1 malto-oligosyltrehalose synthase [Leifsonia poae]